jgi:hypothetical protein
MSSQAPELIQIAKCRRRIEQQRQADALVLPSPGLPEEPASFLKLLVETGKGTDHGAAPVPGAALAFAHHTPAGPLEETNMS